MGPQEHAFRSGVDVIVATPGPAARPLPHALREARRASSSWCSTRRTGCSTWASCPTSAAVLQHLPAQAADAVLQRHDAARRSWRSRARCCTTRSTINLERQAGAGGRASPRRSTRCRRSSSRRCSLELLQRGDMQRGARLHAHQAPRQPARGVPGASTASRPSASTATAPRRSAPRRWPGSRAGSYRVLVATDIAARGIDVEALGHVVNFDVPHRAGGLHPPRRPHRARRADRRRVHLRVARGGAGSARDRARDRPEAAARHGARLRLRGAGRSEARDPARRAHRAIRAKKAEDRARAKAKAARREAHGQASSARPASRPDRPGSGAGQRGPGRGGPGSGGRPGRRRAAGREWRGRRPAGGSRGTLSSRRSATTLVTLSNAKGACLEACPLRVRSG